MKACQGKVVYISGSISLDPNFKEKFRRAAMSVMDAGAKRCLNPAELPAGWDYGEYMDHCMLMVRRSEVLVMLPCWRSSPGAKAEKAFAESLRLTVVELPTVGEA